MYNDILYTLTAPSAGQKIHGVSKSSNRVVSTCALQTAQSLGMVRDLEAYRCRTVHDAVYLIYVLPPEADMSSRFRKKLAVLSNPVAQAIHICTHPGCSGYHSPLMHQQAAASLQQLRWLLILLAIISLLLGSNGILGTQLWSLFLSLLRLMFPL